MGLFDYVNVHLDEDDPEILVFQVKCWDNLMRTFKVGDSVPFVDGHKSYVVALREGGFLHVYRGILAAYEKELKNDQNLPVFDKWGDPYKSPDSPSGLLGDAYQFESGK